MDELNNQNPNEPDNSQNQNSNPYQGGIDPFANVNQDIYQNSDPYASLNPDSQMTNPYGDMSSNPYGDPFASMAPNMDNTANQGFDANSTSFPNQNDINAPQVDNNMQSSDDIDSLMSNMPDPNVANVEQASNDFSDQYSIPNEANNPNGNTVNDYNQAPMVDSNINDFDNQGTINPILSQTLPTDNMANNAQDVNNNMQDFNYTDPNVMQNNNYADPNMNYQDSSYMDPNAMQNNNYADHSMAYQENNYSDPNANFQGNNFTDPNANYAPVNNGFDQNSNFNQDQNNTNYQSGNYSADFTKAWMGTLYDKAQNSKFNWPAAIFGGAYFLFRKMYLTGILFTLLSLLLNMIFMFLLTKIGVAALALTSVVNIAFIFVYGFSFYPLYRKFVQNKLNKMKQAIPDNSQLVAEAQKKGNTSVLALILYFVITPIVVSIVLGIFITAGIINFTSNLFGASKGPTNEIPEVQEPDSDIQLYNFTDKYLVEYDSLTWFLDEETSSLTKGDYTLQFAQALDNINETFNVDVTTPDGRSTLLTTLISSIEGQAAQLNLSVESGLSNFVMGTNAYYGYVDVIDATTISRYYFILLPDNNVLFQFVLTVNDTSVDYETSIEAINILTSVYEDQDYSEQLDEDENEDENNNENETTEEDNSTNTSASNEVSNDTSEENVTSENTTSDVSESENTASENVALSDVLG